MRFLFILAALLIGTPAMASPDALGNIRDRDIGTRTIDIAYNADNQVANVTDSANPYRAFTHDARGNVTNDGRYTFVYDFSDQPTSVSDTGGLLASYEYDGNKKRVKSVVGGVTRYFVYSAVTGGLIFMDEVQSGSSVKTTDYASIGPAAVRIENGSTPVYTHADHLGSPVASTDAAGDPDWSEGYMPFGETLNLDGGANDDNTGYTGHVEDAVTGLTYMQARYFDPVIGRFYSTDPIDYQDQLNLYAYVGNDPVNATDPTGEFGVAGFLIGAGLDLAIQVGSNLASGQSLGESVSNVNVGTVLLSGALGAVGQVGGATAARSVVSGLSNGAKGKIGEAVARVGIAAKGQKVIASQTKVSRTPGLENVTGRGAKSVPDFAVQGKNGATEVVEAKFGTSQLTGAQRDLKNQLGDAVSVVRTTADDVANAGGAAGGIAGGSAGAAAGAAMRSCSTDNNNC